MEYKEDWNLLVDVCQYLNGISDRIPLEKNERGLYELSDRELELIRKMLKPHYELARHYCELDQEGRLVILPVKSDNLQDKQNAIK